MFQNLSAHPSLEIDFQTNFQTKGFDDSGNVTSGKVLSLVGQMHTNAQCTIHTNTQAQEEMRKSAQFLQVQDKNVYERKNKCTQCTMYTYTSVQYKRTRTKRKNAPCSQELDKMYTGARTNAQNVHKRTMHTRTQTQDQMYTSATKVPCGFPQLTQTNLGQLSLCYNNQHVNAASSYVQKYYEAFLSVLAPRVENASSSYY